MKLTEEMLNNGYNSCDKCRHIAQSEDLVWLTAEGFQPKKGEIVPQWAYKKYDALCEPCYFEVINSNK